MIDALNTAWKLWILHCSVYCLASVVIIGFAVWFWQLVGEKVRRLCKLGIVAILMCALALYASMTNNFETQEEKEELRALQLQEQSELRSLAGLLVPQADQRLRDETLPNLLGALSGSQTIPHWAHGVYEDGQRVCFDSDWVFPCGTGHLASVEVLSEGAILPDGFSAEPIAAFAAHLTLVPGVSDFHYGRTPSNSYEFVWTDARDGRIGGTPFSGRIELFRNGDVAIDANGAAALLPRTLPFAHDGFGQDAEWVEANFARLQALSPSLTNAAEILSVGYTNWVDGQVGIDLTNGLYKFTVTFAAAPPEATLLTVGDYSVAVTNAGDYTFILGKGIEYPFCTTPATSNVAFSAVDDLASSAEPRMMLLSMRPEGRWKGDPGRLEIRVPNPLLPGYELGSIIWLPSISVSPENWDPINDMSETFTAAVSDLPWFCSPAYDWQTSDASVISIESPSAQTTEMTSEQPAAVTSVSLAVNVPFCSECVSASFNYEYGDENDGGPVISVIAPETMFANDDDDDDDGVVDRESPSPFLDDDIVRGSITFHSDVPTNGVISIDTLDFNGVVYSDSSLDAEIDGATTWSLEGSTEWSANLYFNPEFRDARYRRSSIKVRWTPSVGPQRTSIARFTVVEPVAEPICSETTDVVENGVARKLALNPCGVGVGRDAYFKVRVSPADCPDEKIVWSQSGSGSVEFCDGGTGRVIRVRGIAPGDLSLSVAIGEAASPQPSFPLKVVTNSVIKLSAWIVSRDGLVSKTENEIRKMVADVNDIYAQVGVCFDIGDRIVVTNIPDAYDVLLEAPTNVALAGGFQTWTTDNLFDLNHSTAGLELYFVRKILDVDPDDSSMTVGCNSRSGMALTAKATADTLAHEVGHAFQMRDIYIRKDGVVLPSEKVSRSFAQSDWNGGSGGSGDGGARYYTLGFFQEDLIRTLLMNGLKDGGSGDRDISYGPIWGLDVHHNQVQVQCGFFDNPLHDSAPVHQ